LGENEWTTFGENRWTNLGENGWPSMGEKHMDHYSPKDDIGEIRLAEAAPPEVAAASADLL
jgi:hypothetical protein